MVSRITVEKFFSHSAEKFLSGIFYCFNNFRYRKLLGIEEGGEHDIWSKNFRLPVPKKFVEGSFTASLISSIEKC